MMQICDAVAVAGLLNATLVIPIFHLNSVWRDSRLLLVTKFVIPIMELVCEQKKFVTLEMD